VNSKKLFMPTLL